MLGSSITMENAMQLVGNAVGQPSEKQQIDAVNEIRTWLYAMQQKVSLDLSERFCLPLQEMNSFCNECEGSFIGFRLPQANNSIEAVYYMSKPLDTYSRYRTPYDGSKYGCELVVFDNGYSALQFDTKLKRSKLHFMAESPKDEGTEITITGETDEGRETVKYSLTTGRQESKAFKHVASVQFSKPLAGRVTLNDDNQALLARYNAGETFPRYRTFRVESLNTCAGSVLVVANRRYVDLSDKHDIVEVGNLVVWKSLAKYFYLYNKEERNANDRANMQDFMKEAMNLLVEEADVENNENLTTEFRRKRAGYAGLNSQRKYRRRGKW